MLCSLSVSEVMELALLVNNAHRCLLRPDLDGLDVLGGLAELLEAVVVREGGLDGGLRVELGGEGDFEEDVLHDVGAVGALELEWFALAAMINQEGRTASAGNGTLNNTS